MTRSRWFLVSSNVLAGIGIMFIITDNIWNDQIPGLGKTVDASGGFLLLCAAVIRGLIYYVHRKPGEGFRFGWIMVLAMFLLGMIYGVVSN